jgi:hypothetical protein
MEGVKSTAKQPDSFQKTSLANGDGFMVRNLKPL